MVSRLLLEMGNIRTVGKEVVKLGLIIYLSCTSNKLTIEGCLHSRWGMQSYYHMKNSCLKHVNQMACNFFTYYI